MNTIPELWLDWMTDSMVQISVLIILIGAITWFGRRLSARLRYALWMLVLIKALLPPFWSVPFSVANLSAPLIVQTTKEQAIKEPGMKRSAIPGRSENAIPGRYEDTALEFSEDAFFADEMSGDDAGTPASAPAPFAQSSNRPALLFAVWLGGMASFWGVMFCRYVRAVRLLGEGRILKTGPILVTLDRLRKRLGVKARPQVVLSQAVGSPFLWGLWRPSIALPAEFPGEVSAEELEAVLLHELVHWKRGDLVVTQLELFVLGIFWYHPLVWAVVAAIRRERESACDEAVLSTGNIDAKRYGDSLLNVMEFVRDRTPLPVGFLGTLGIMERKSQLRQRMEEIMTQHNRVRKIGLFGWIILFFFAVCVLPMAIAKQKTTEQKATEQKPATEPEASASEKPAASDNASDTATEKPAEEGYTTPPVSLQWAGIGVALSSKDGNMVVEKLIKGGPAEKSGEIHPGDIIQGIGQGKDGIIEKNTDFAVDVAKLKGSKGTVVRLEMLPGGKEPSKIVELVRDEVMWDPGFTHLVFFRPTGDFNPRNPTQFLRVFRLDLREADLQIGYFRTRLVGGKLLGSFCTADPEGFERLVKSSIPEVELTWSERLTKESFEAFEKTKSESLPPVDGGYAVPGLGFTHIVYFGGKGNFEPKSISSLFRRAGDAWKMMGISSGWPSSRVEDGKLIGAILTCDPEGFQAAIDASPELRFLRAERLTEQSYNVYRVYKEVDFRPPADGGFQYHGYQYIVTLKTREGFEPKTAKELFSQLYSAPMHASGLGIYKDGDQIFGTFITDDPDEHKIIIEENPRLEYVKAERLTAESYMSYNSTYRIDIQ